MRNISMVFVFLTIILFSVFIICSLTTLSVKDDELEYAVGYAAEMTIDSLDNGYLSGKNIKPNENYSRYYHYNTAISDSITELYTEGLITAEQNEYIEQQNFMHVSQILNSEYVRSIDEHLPEHFANIVIEKVFINILTEIKDSNAVYDVEFYYVDAVNGILDVQVTQSSKYNYNNTCKTSVRKTVIKEDLGK